ALRLHPTKRTRFYCAATHRAPLRDSRAPCSGTDRRNGNGCAGHSLCDLKRAFAVLLSSGWNGGIDDESRDGSARRARLEKCGDLGIAMQLTNIAHDIIEDAAMGRVYLPLAWLREAEIEPDDVAASRHRKKLSMLTLRLLHEAERFY